MEKDRKELNLVDVFSLIGKGLSRFVRWCLRACVWCLRLLFRHKGVSLTFFLAGIAAGIFTYLTMNPFKSGFVLTNSTGKIYYAIEEAREMTRYCQKKGHLASFLEIEDSIASQVKEVNAYYVVDRWHDNIIDLIDFKEKYGEDTLVNTWSTSRFYVEVLTASEEVVPELQKAIVKKLSQNETVRTSWETAVTSQKQWIESYRHDLHQLDSVQSILYAAENLTSNLSARMSSDRLQLVSESRVQVFSRDRQYLLENWASTQRYLDELGPTPVYASLPIQYEGKATSIFMSLILYGGLGLLIAFLISLLAEKKEALTAFLRG